jgi:hypothetical protein
LEIAMKHALTFGFAAALLMSAPAFAAIDASPSSTEHKAAPHGSRAEMAMNAREAKTTQELNQQANQNATPDAPAAMPMASTSSGMSGTEMSSGPASKTMPSAGGSATNTPAQ